MADRYWVGGTGNWSDATNHWSDSSGGSPNASFLPTAADNVIFDAGSDAGGIFTVTVDGTSASPSLCQDFTAGSLDFAMTLSMSATAFLDCYGSMTLPATNFTVSASTGAFVRFKAISTGKTITTNGVSLTALGLNFDGLNGEWTLGSALTSTGNATVSTGSFITNSFNLTVNQLNIAANANVKNVSLGSSSVVLASSAPFTNNSTGNLTFNAGTSTIVCSAASATFSGGGFTYYNVSFTSTANSGTVVSGSNTFNNLSMATPGVYRNFQFNGSQIINGTLTLGTTNAAVKRIRVFSGDVGTAVTLTVNGTLATLSDVDFRDITAAGTAATPWTGTRLGNAGGNTNITFDAGKNVYRIGTGGWSATQWALTSGGAVNLNNFPLPQDTAIFDTNTVTGTHSIDAQWWIGSLDTSALNVAITLANTTQTPVVHGNVTLDSDVTLTGTGAWQISGASTQTITSAGVAFPMSLTINKPAGTSFLLGDALTTVGTFTLTQGTLDLNGFNLTTAIFSSSVTTTRSIDFGTNKIVVTGNAATVISIGTATNFSYTGTSRVELTYSGAVGTRSISMVAAGGATESNALNLYVTAGSDIVTTGISSTGVYKTIDFTGFSGTYLNGVRNVYGNFVVSPTMTVEAGTYQTFFAASSGTQQLTTNGKTLDFPIILQTTSGAALQLQDNLTIGSTRTFSVTSGVLDVNGKTLTTGVFSSSNSNVRTINLGSGGTINVTGNSWLTSTVSNLTLAGTGTIDMTSASLKTLSSGGLVFPYKLNQGGAGELIITGTNTFAEISNTVQPATITFPNVTTTIGKWSVKGTAGNLITLQRTGASGTFTLAYNGSSNVTSDYLSISNSTGSTANTWYAGVNSVDGGGNTNWNFTYGAVRYWVGGTGNWDQSTTTNWAYLSGYAGGAPAPTANDDVYFDANSDVGAGFTVNILGVSATPSLCRDFTASGLDGAMTLSMPATSFLSVYGSLTLPATNFTWTGVSQCTLRFTATTTGKTITTNGVTINLGAGSSAILLDGAGGEWTLGGALTVLGRIDTYGGTFRTNNYNVSCGAWNFLGVSTTRAIYLGSSVFTTSGSTLGNGSTTTGLTLDAGTSQINCTAASVTFSGGNQTFYNVAFTSTSSGQAIITGANTFNNLSVTSLASTGTRRVSIGANQTVSGTLTLGSANTAIRRVQLFSDVVGTPRTVTLNGTLAPLADVDFKDITAAGTAGIWTGTRLGNAGGNSNITFDAGKTVYKVGTGNWTTTTWSLTSGGSVDVNNFPLAQDTAVFDTGTVTGTHSIDGSWFLGSLDASDLDVAVTIGVGTNVPVFHGNVTLDSDVTLTGTGGWGFSGSSNQTITSAGVTFTPPITINKPVGTSLLLGDALTSTGFTSPAGINLLQGILNLNSYDLTCVAFYSRNRNTRSIVFGTNKIIVTGNNINVVDFLTATNFTYTGSGLFEATYSGSTGQRGFVCGSTDGNENNAISINVTAGTDNVYIGGTSASTNAHFKNVNLTGFSGTLLNNVRSIYGDTTISSTATIQAGSNETRLTKTSGTQQITTNGKILDFPITQNGVGGTVQLQDNLTLGSTRNYTLTNGVLNLNGFDLTTGLFSSSNTNVRSIAFGTNKIDVTGSNTTVAAMNPMTGFTYTGISNITGSYSGSTGSRTFDFRSGNESNALNVNIVNGSDTILMGTTNFVRNIIYTNFTGVASISAGIVYGDISLSAGSSVAASTSGPTLSATTGTQNITTNGVFIDRPIIQNGIGGTVQLVDNLTMGSTRAYTLTNGTLDLNENKLTCGTFSSSNSNVRSIAFGVAGEIDCLTWTATTGTNLTTSGTGRINMTNASAKTFAGGGASYPTLNQGGLGTLSITGNNTFADMTNTVQPTTITFAAGSTTSVSDFNVSGTAGNLVTLNSSVPGTKWTIVKV